MIDTITQEERAELRELAQHVTPGPYFEDGYDVQDNADNCVARCNGGLNELPEDTQESFAHFIAAACNMAPRLLTSLEAAEAHAAKNADDLRKASAMAIHAETRAEQAEAENARLQKMVEWLAAELSDGCSTSRCIYHGATESCPLECGEHSTGHWQEAARRAVAGGVMTAIPHTIHNNTQPRE